MPSRLSILLLGPLIYSAGYAATFEFQSRRVPVGQVFHYLKSNIDGSNLNRICVYVASADRIESLKWHEGSTGATLVIAEMDWSKFSVRRFEAWHLDAAAAPQQRAWLQANEAGTELDVSFLGDRKARLNHWPWHSYDFDFASLSVTLPHVQDPTREITFWRSDVVHGETMDFAEIGEVRLRPEAVESRSGYRVRRYAIAGRGLDDTTGVLWTDADTGIIGEYQIPIPDEPGYANGRLKLLGTEPMTLERWERYKEEKTKGWSEP
jgi:hypothetical protein